VLSNVDLAACRFSGATNVDRLRYEGEPSFARIPSRLGWGGRRAIAEEHEWRAANLRVRDPKKRSPTSADFPKEWRELDPPVPLLPGEIAGIYRDLRKGLEERKNEPGAADFYYGEMEMRRHDKTSPLAERWLLTAYWAASGYALRASRAISWLLATVCVFAALLDAWGFTPDESFGRALL